MRGRYVVSRCQCVGTQTKVLCCDQRRVPGWDDEIKHSQMGLHFSQFLIALCISYSLTFVWLIGFVAWTIDTYKLFLDISIIKCVIYSLFEKKQMFDAYLPSNVQNILHISFQSNHLVDIHKIDSQYRVFPAA